jgi:MFS family permease
MLRHTFRALGHAGYRRYFIGQGISQIGNWTQQIVLSWLTYAQSGSVWMLALVVALGQLPLLVLGSYAGMLADRHPRRPLLLACNAFGLLLASGLALSSVSYEPGIGLLLAASLGTGLLNAMEIPARQALLGALIGNRDLRDNALALNALSFNAARLIGPPMAGLLFAHYGATACFALNALSYLAAIYSLWRMSAMDSPVSAPAQAGLDQALRWLRETRPARWLLLTAGISSLCLAPFMALLPVYARDIFALDPVGLGQLLGASGFGALLATLLLAARRNQWRLETFMAGGALLFGLSCLGFACNRHLWLAWPLMVAAGAGLVACVTSSGIALQSLVTDALRGRVMALHGMAYVGSMPLGSLIAGGLAAQLSVQAAFAVAGLGMLTLAALLFWRLAAPDLSRLSSPANRCH